jgi:hypothetical protein
MKEASEALDGNLGGGREILGDALVGLEMGRCRVKYFEKRL